MTKEYIELPRFLDKKNINSSEIKTLEIALEEAKEAYRESEGKNLFEMMSNENCPSMLKDFIKKHNIYKVAFEKVTQYEDYMPDYGKYIILQGNDRFGFMFECTESYAEDISPFDGTEFKHDIDFVEVLKENELLKPENEWKNEDTEQALEVWEYVLSFSNVGYERKLFI